jgi:photosystem II stability/assembly factor-like uncharacterized protein
MAPPPSFFTPLTNRRHRPAVWRHRFLVLAVLTNWLHAQIWVNHDSGVIASLRGVSAVSDRVVWASGSGGAYLTTTDAGATWRAAIVPGAETLDFRGIRAVDARTLYLLASGPGEK